LSAPRFTLVIPFCAKHKVLTLFKIAMSDSKRIFDLKQYANKLLEEIEVEMGEKSKLIENLNKEVAELKKQKEAINQILAKIGEIESAPTGSSKTGVKVEAKVEIVEGKPSQKETKATDVVAQEKPREAVRMPADTVSQEAAAAASKPSSAAVPSQEMPTWPVTKEPPSQKRAEDRWEPISLNSVDYARYRVGKSAIEIEFKFKVPQDSKYVRGFIVDKYLQKLKEEGEEAARTGAAQQGQTFDYEIGATEKGEITSIVIRNYPQEQLTDLLSKIRWFVVSEVRDLKNKGRL